jgi:protein-arginine kinase activator protein McsA
VGGYPCDKKQCENEATIRVFGLTEEEKRQPPMVVCDRCYEEFAKLNSDYPYERIT